MHTQTFGNRSVGLADITSAIASAFAPVLTVLGAVSQSRARAELLRMADFQAASQPEFAARLRGAARRNWYGEA